MQSHIVFLFVTTLKIFHIYMTTMLDMINSDCGCTHTGEYLAFSFMNQRESVFWVKLCELRQTFVLSQAMILRSELIQQKSSFQTPPLPY